MVCPTFRSRLALTAAMVLWMGWGCGDSKSKPLVPDAAIPVVGPDAEPCCAEPDAALAVDAAVADTTTTVTTTTATTTTTTSTTLTVTDTGTTTGSLDCVIPAYLAAQPTPIGWANCTSATVCADTTVTGGGAATPITVSTLPELTAALAATGPKVIYVKGTIAMNATAGQAISISSNTTLIGCGATSVPATNQGHLVGSIHISGSSNVVLRNLLIEGYNCTDKGPMTYLTGAFAGKPDCQQGLDAVSVMNGAHNIWFDHVSIFDGSDGNLDITLQANYVTVSWTKFSYSAARTDYTDKDTPDTGSAEPSGHRFSNLVGGDDNAPDSGTLNVTWHHNWWGQNVLQRQPRVRFGKNHLFNNLYTSAGSSYCVGLGVSANIRMENNIFGTGVNKPINTASYSNASSILSATGSSPATLNVTYPAGATVFTPPYLFTLEDTATVQATIEASAGPK